MVSTTFTASSVLHIFSLSFSFIFFLYQSLLSDIDVVLSINPAANTFLFGEFNVHHKDWLACSYRPERSDKLSSNCS